MTILKKITSILLIGLASCMNRDQKIACPNLLDGSYSLFVIPSISDSLPLPFSQFPTVQKSDTIRLFASPDEYEPASFAIQAFKELKDIRFEISNLKMDNGDSYIESSNINLRIVKCWYQSGGFKGNEPRKEKVAVLTPELLLNNDALIKVDYNLKTNFILPLNKIQDSKKILPVTIPDGTMKQFWLTLYIPENQPSGIYKGTIKVMPANAPSSILYLEAEVLPIILQKPCLNYGVVYVGRITENKNNNVNSPFSKTESQYFADIKNIKKHGSFPTIYASIYNGAKKPKNTWELDYLRKTLKIWKNAGLSNIPFFYVDFPLWQHGKPIVEVNELEKLKAFVSQVISIARDNGFPDVYFIINDEDSGDVLKAKRKSCQTIHDAGGKTAGWVLKGYYELIGDLLDIAIINGAIPWNRDEMHSIGHKVYNYAHPQSGFASPCRYRWNYGFYLWKSGFDGTLVRIPVNLDSNS